MKLVLAILSLLLFMVSISGAADNPKTTVAPNNKDAPTKTAPAKEIATAKSVDGKEDETKNVKKGDLGKESKKNESSEESPSEDAQEDLGVEENRGPTIPAYQIPEQPKDVKRKKRWDNSIGYAIDNALGAIFGRPPPPPPADTVIEEITYVDEYPHGPVVYKRSKGLPPPSKSEADKNDTNPTKELADAPIDSVDTISLKGEPIAISKPEVEAKTPVVSIKNALPKMEVGNEVTILPAIDEEKDFGSSAENVEEMKYQRIAPEVAGLIKKSVPLSENTNSTGEASEGKSSEKENEEASKAKSSDKNKDETVPEDKSSSDGKEELQEKQMKDKSDANDNKDDKKGEKEFVPVYPEDDTDSEDEETAEKPQKDNSKAFEMEKTAESESQKGESKVAEASEERDSSGEELNNKSENDKTPKGSKDEASKIGDEKDKATEKNDKVNAEEKPRHREPEELPVNPKTTDEKDEDKAAEELPLVDHEPKKLPEEEKDDASEKSEEEEIEDKVEKNNDDEGANIEKDEYAPADGKVEEDKAKIDAINPVSPEIKESKEAKKPIKIEKGDEKLGPAPYPSEISDDDFSIDHKTGLMPAVSSSSNDNDDSDSNIPEASENEKGDDYNVLQKLQDDVDAAAKKDQSPDYIVMEELKDPIQGHRKFTILKPNYRAFHPTDNKLIEEVKATLDKSKIEKRSIKSVEENESEEEAFESSFSKDTVIESDSNEILKNVADAIERDGLRKPKKDQQPMFIPDDYPIPLKEIEKPTLNQILGIPESAGPIMIEPEGGLPKGLKKVQSDSDESEFINPDYDAPQKVVIESKQKITLVYDDSSEEATKDSSSESSEEKQQWIPIMDIATIITDQTSQKSKPIVTKVEDPEQQPPTALPMKHSEAYEEQLKKYSNILGNNLVITLSISPPILIIAGVICLTLLLFKVYWILYSPPLKGSIIPQNSSSSSSSAAATTPNMDFRTPLSIVTVNDNPKKLPL